MNWTAFKKMTFKQKLFAIFVLVPAMWIFVGIAKAVSAKMEEKKRYKKVIKKGLLWDTEYLIERD